MRPTEHLDLWEQGARQSSLERGLSMASHVAPTVAETPLGVRNERLLALRTRLFGGWVEALASCPACGEWVELSFTASIPAGLASSAPFRFDGYAIEYRLPTSLDLAYAMRFDDLDAAALAIAERCIVSASRDGAPEGFDVIPTEVLEALGERMDGEDPGAAPSASLTCPTCGEGWTALFDVEPFVWRETSIAARRLLGEVHELAVAYGWSEDAVLALSTERRRAYLEMVRE